MSSIDVDDPQDYVIVVNDEEQYSIWLADRAAPHGWRVVGSKQPKVACLKEIGTLWSDMRPRSLRGSTPG